ncbi:MAG TPA: SAM hydroxide adenosyltransferase, partial [Thermoanaerobaculia bacterium]
SRGLPAHDGERARGGDPSTALGTTPIFLPNGSNTFHGRDRFAPVAAALANGLAIETLGPRIDDRVQLAYEPPSYGDVVRGTIVSIDRFGNAITDVEVSRCRPAASALRVRGHVITRFETSYGDAGEGVFLIAGSTGCVEISEANGSAAARLQLSTLDRLELWPK